MVDASPGRANAADAGYALPGLRRLTLALAVLPCYAKHFLATPYRTVSFTRGVHLPERLARRFHFAAFNTLLELLLTAYTEMTGVALPKEAGKLAGSLHPLCTDI